MIQRVCGGVVLLLIALTVCAAQDVVSAVEGTVNRIDASTKTFAVKTADGAELQVFLEPILPTPTVYVFGGGHVSFFLVRAAKLAGFKAKVIDDSKVKLTWLTYSEINNDYFTIERSAFSGLNSLPMFDFWFPVS